MIIALLSFFDETPDLLYKSTSLVMRAGADHVIAVDGPYELYPNNGCYRSDLECHTAIKEAAVEANSSWTIVTTTYAWAGNEVGKRAELMRLGTSLSDDYDWMRDRDWLLVFDADHFWESDEDLHRLLHPTQVPGRIDFARVSFAEVFEPDGTPIFAPARPLMRARRDLVMGTNHYTYETTDGFSTFLERPTPTAPALDLTRHVRVIHGVHDRDPERRSRQATYYYGRDTKGAER